MSSCVLFPAAVWDSVGLSICRVQAAIGKSIQRQLEAAPLKRGFWGLWLQGNSPISNKTPKTVKSLSFVSVLSHLINLKCICILVLTVLNFFKLQFHSLSTQFFQGRQMYSFTPGADCHFSPHSISHPHQETTQISTAAFPVAVPQVLSQLCSPAHPCTWAQSRFTHSLG